VVGGTFAGAVCLPLEAELEGAWAWFAGGWGGEGGRWEEEGEGGEEEEEEEGVERGEEDAHWTCGWSVVVS